MLQERLKTLNTDRLNVDEAVELLAQSRQVAAEYDLQQLPQPSWLRDGAMLLANEVSRKRRDALLARRRELEAQQAALKTPQERRRDIEAELSKVNDALGATS